MSSGLFLIDRAIFDHPVVGVHRPKWFAAWIWMLGEARWKSCRLDVDGKTITLERGQLSCSYRFMAKRLGMSVKEIRGFVTRLKTDTMIGTTKGTGQTVITIMNYDTYQDFTEYRAHEKAHEKAQQGHSKGTARAQTITPEGTPDAKPDIKEVEEIAFDLWNELASRTIVPVAMSFSEARKKGIACRLKDCNGIKGWKAALLKVEKSDHCMGVNDRGWVANLDFMLKASKFTRLMEGNYDNRTGGGNTKKVNGRGSGRGSFVEAARDILRESELRLHPEGNGGGGQPDSSGYSPGDNAVTVGGSKHS